MGRGDLMDPIQVCSIYIILKLRDGHLSSLDAFPESLIRRKSSKKTNSIFILLPAYRQENKQEKEERLSGETQLPKIEVLDSTSFSGFHPYPNSHAMRRTNETDMNIPYSCWSFACVSSLSPKPQISKVHQLSQYLISSSISFYEP